MHKCHGPDNSLYWLPAWEAHLQGTLHFISGVMRSHKVIQLSSYLLSSNPAAKSLAPGIHIKTWQTNHLLCGTRVAPLHKRPASVALLHSQEPASLTELFCSLGYILRCQASSSVSPAVSTLPSPTSLIPFSSFHLQPVPVPFPITFSLHCSLSLRACGLSPPQG